MAHLIDKDALVAEIKRRKEESWLGHYTKEKGIVFDITDDILSFINTLEVKEVDLEKESLTWKDIGTIDQLLWDLSGEHSGKSDNEGYYKAVLNKYKAQKGE